MVAHEDYSWEAEQLRAQLHIPVGGRLRFFWKFWREIGASRKIARWLNRGYRLPFASGEETEARKLLTTSCPSFLIPGYAKGSEKAVVLHDMIIDLLQKDVIEKVPVGSPCFFNVVFLRPKPNGKWRLIIDVSRLNQFLVVKKFRMDTVQLMRDAVEPDMWATSIDLSEAFHHIPIHQNFRCFLAFCIQGQNYWYKACPFGLSPIPQVFTEVCTVVKVFARKTFNCTIYSYLDDWLFLSPSRAKTAVVTRAFVRLCIKLGLLVNLEKSALSPSQRLVHLGVDWDFRLAQVKTPQDKIDVIAETAGRIASANRSPLPLLESLMGRLISVERVVHFGRLHYRPFQAELIMFLRDGRSFRWVKLTHAAKCSLRWWANKANLQKWVPVRVGKPSLVVHTDASKAGWGAACDLGHLQGVWSKQESKLHINILEMMAVQLTVARWMSWLRGQTVLFKIDNLSVVYYITKQGGTRSPTLLRVVHDLLLLTEKENITLLASHVKGDLNVLADMLSRKDSILKHEWRLGDASFHWLRARSPWGDPWCELFANKLNHHLARYVSPCPDSEAWAVDALVCSWPRQTCYAFPPTALLDKVVTKIQQERPSGLLLVAPLWPHTTWFPILQAHAVATHRFPTEILSLHQPHFQHQMPNPEQLCLALWCISFTD